MIKRRKNKIVKKGFSYHVTEEQIRSYMKFPASKKLLWLEEAIRFSHYALTENKKRIWEAFRRGEI
ncbi:MAG: hypothetical protein A2W05_06270 [Candidatus Schekmanbacteria bacterium RBG_16_38_10]|uniref:Uncharacterized protein n=1 Tax=Candidatus Schekmanbacteria bacterium RBG_16_38_10 TaxID=1817879 RepID=A0A1F7RS51_9BACT|nr:MAG: hypothetical protein A2W05_06270 [Candidatus Schekmanbacteria bacterium RBG_16_38_10]